MDEYIAGRARFSRDEWLDLVMRSIGLEPAHFDLRGKLLAVMRLVPMAERNYNLIELGPWGTGKSFVYRETSPNAMLISGGKVTRRPAVREPQLGADRTARHVGRRRVRRGRRA